MYEHEDLCGNYQAWSVEFLLPDHGVRCLAADPLNAGRRSTLLERRGPDLAGSWSGRTNR